MSSKSSKKKFSAAWRFDEATDRLLHQAMEASGWTRTEIIQRAVETYVLHGGLTADMNAGLERLRILVSPQGANKIGNKP